MPSYVAAFRTYEWDDDIAELAERLFTACPSARHVLLIDETRGQIDTPGYEKVSHTDDTSSFGLPDHPKGRSLWYNGDYGIYFLRRALPDFDFYLLSESDLAVNLSCEPMIALASERKLDAIVHNLAKSTPDWVWHESSVATLKDPWQAFLYFMVLSGRAIDTLLTARQKLAQKLASGAITDWPICESFLPTVLSTTPGMQFADIGEFASVENLNHRPRISLRDPRASAPGSLVHSVLGSERFISTLLAEHDPRDYFRSGTELQEGLVQEPFEAFAEPLRSALVEKREHASLARLQEEMALHGIPSDVTADLAYCKPALSSSVSTWSHFDDPQHDAAGANGESLAEDYGFHTKWEANPWWMVDLLDEYSVEEIAIVNRHSHSDRFTTFQIQSSRDGVAWITRFTKLDLEEISSDPAMPWRLSVSDPFLARYVRIYLLDNPGILHLRKVQVFGRGRPGQEIPPAAIGTDISTGVSRSDVIEAYRAVLGRAPESELAIQDHMAAATVAELYQGLIESEEFQENFKATLDPLDQPTTHVERTLLESLDWSPIDVESTVANGAQLDEMFVRASAAWTRLGELDPYFSVCTDPRFLGVEIGERGEEFYASGENDLRHLTSFAARSGIDLMGRTCLELGCGVGRVTRWLAPLFRRVRAIDISPGHLAIAQREMAEAGIENVSLTQISSLEDLRQIVGYDVFFSILVLQHNPPPVTAYVLMQVLTNLNSGGVGFFQVPTYGLGYSFRVDEYLNKPVPEEPEIEMHVLPQRDILSIVQKAGCRILELREDDYTGSSDAISNTFFVEKR